MTRSGKHLIQIESQLLFLIIICISCSDFAKDSIIKKTLSGNTLSERIDSLMINSRWNFEKLCLESIGPQLVFDDSIKTLDVYQKLILEEGYIDTLIQKYNLFPDNCYSPGYCNAGDWGGEKMFRYELLLCQEDLINMLGSKKIDLLQIVTRKYYSKYGEYIQPYFARVSGACLTSRILNNLKYPQFLEELSKNSKIQSILNFSEPIQYLEDSTSYSIINQIGINCLQSK